MPSTPSTPSSSSSSKSPSERGSTSGTSSLNAASSSSSSSSSSSPQSGWICDADFCAWSLSLFFNPLLAGGPTPFRPGRVGFAAGAFAPEPLPLPPAPPFALPPALFVAAPIVVRELAGRRAAAPADPRRAKNASVAAVERAMPPIDAETPRASDAATGLGADPTRGGARSSNDVRGEDSIAPLLSQLMHARPTPPPMPPSTRLGRVALSEGDTGGARPIP